MRKNNKFYNKTTKRYNKFSKNNVAKYNSNPNNFLLPANIRNLNYVKNRNTGKINLRTTATGKQTVSSIRNRFRKLVRENTRISRRSVNPIQTSSHNYIQVDTAQGIYEKNYDFKPMNNVDILNQMRMFKVMNKLGVSGVPAGATVKYQILLKNTMFRNVSSIMNTKRYDNFEDALAEMNYKLNQEEDYDDYMEGDFDAIVIRVSWASDSQGVLGMGSLATDIENDEWFAYDKLSSKNCFWNSLYVARNPAELCEMISNGNDNNISRRACNLKNKFKANCDKLGIYFNKNVAFDIVKDGKNYVNILGESKGYKVIINVYDEAYEIKYVLKPDNYDEKYQYKILNMRKIGGHIQPIFRYEILKEMKLDVKGIIINSKKQIEEHLGSKLITRGRKRMVYDNDELFKEIKAEVSMEIKEAYGKIKGQEKLRNSETTKRYKEQGGTISMSNKDLVIDRKIMSLDIEASNNDESLQDYKHGIRWYKEEMDKECNIGVFKSYVVAVGWIEDGKEMYKDWKDTRHKDGNEKSCLMKFLDWLDEEQEKFKNYKIYAHNGGRFDWNLFLSEGLSTNNKWLIETDKVIELNGCYINIPLKHKETGNKVELRDSYRILSGRLDDLTQEFQVKNKKLTGEVDFNTITFQNWFLQEEKIDRYLYNDVIGLLQVLNKFVEQVWSEFKINITNCFTSATLAKQFWFLNNYDETKYPVFNLARDVENFIKRSYFGGRCECFYKGNITTGFKHIKKSNKVYYVDFTSLYPWAMTMEIPYGLPVYYKFKEVHTTIQRLKTIENFEKNRWLFVKCKVKSINFSKKPLHAMKDDAGRLVFRYYKEPVEMVLNACELLKGHYEKLYEYEIIDAYIFRKAKFFKKAMIDLFERKAQAKAEGNKVLASINKIVANSLYGFWCFERFDRQGVRFYEKDNFNKLLTDFKENKLVEWKECGDYLVGRVNDDVDMETCNKAIGSAITSIARTKLWSLMNDIEKKKGDIIYCDTDSVMTNYNLFADEKLRKKYQWDGDGSELGSLKNECDDEVIDEYRDTYAKKMFDNKFKLCSKIQKEAVKDRVKPLLKLEEDNDNGAYAFDNLIIGACKMYHIGKKLNFGLCKDKYIEINKMKGWKKHYKKGKNYDMRLTKIDNESNILEAGDWKETGLDLEVFKHLANGGGIQQAGESWINHKLVNGYVDMDKEKIKGKINPLHEDFNMLIKYQLRQFKSIYTKGDIQHIQDDFDRIDALVV